MRHSAPHLAIFTTSALAAVSLATVGLAGSPPAGAAEDLRIRQLENEVMRLQRQIDAQSHRIEDLERSARNASVSRPAAPVARASNNSPAWLVTANWDRLKPGMKELDVIAVLGRPTSVRIEDDGRTRALLYAMELGPEAVLAGSVRMGDTGVAEINRPELR